MRSEPNAVVPAKFRSSTPKHVVNQHSFGDRDKRKLLTLHKGHSWRLLDLKHPVMHSRQNRWLQGNTCTSSNTHRLKMHRQKAGDRRGEEGRSCEGRANSWHQMLCGKGGRFSALWYAWNVECRTLCERTSARHGLKRIRSNDLFPINPTLAHREQRWQHRPNTCLSVLAREQHKAKV